MIREENSSLSRTPDFCHGLLEVWVRKRRTLVLSGALLIVVLAADGVRRVRVHDSWLDGFSPRSAFAQANERFEQHFLGSHQLLVAAQLDSWRMSGQIPGAQIEHDRLTLPGIGSPGTEALPRDVERLIGSWIRVTQRDRGSGPDGAPRNWTAAVASAREEHRSGGDNRLRRLSRLLT